MAYLTISTNVDAIKHITDGRFFFQEDSALVHCAHSPTAAALSTRLILHLTEKCYFVFPHFAV